MTSPQRSYNPSAVSISRKYGRHIVSDAVTDDPIAKRMLAQEAGSEAHFYRARHAVRGAVSAPALTVERWILQANASDRASVKVSQLRVLLDAIKSVALVGELGDACEALGISSQVSGRR